jgi:hypothetical protein
MITDEQTNLALILGDISTFDANAPKCLDKSRGDESCPYLGRIPIRYISVRAVLDRIGLIPSGHWDILKVISAYVSDILTSRNWSS